MGAFASPVPLPQGPVLLASLSVLASPPPPVLSLGPAEPPLGSHSQLTQHAPGGPSLPCLSGCGLLILPRASQETQCWAQRLLGGKMDGGPGPFSGPRVLDARASVGRRQLCSVVMTGPHPTPQLGTAGRKQEARSRPETRPSSVSAPGRAGTGWPSHKCEGEGAGSHTLPRTGVELFKVALSEGERGSPVASAPPSPRGSLEPQGRSLWPLPSRCRWVSARGSCSRAGQGRAGQGQRTLSRASQPPPVCPHPL